MHAQGALDNDVYAMTIARGTPSSRCDLPPGQRGCAAVPARGTQRNAHGDSTSTRHSGWAPNVARGDERNREDADEYPTSCHAIVGRSVPEPDPVYVPSFAWPCARTDHVRRRLHTLNMCDRIQLFSLYGDALPRAHLRAECHHGFVEDIERVDQDGANWHQGGCPMKWDRFPTATKKRKCSLAAR